MAYVIEKLAWYNEYKYVIIFTSLGHRCGYVAVDNTHPLFGVDYSENIGSKELLQEIKSSQIGKRGLINVMCWDGETTTPSMMIDVHGGITYSGGSHRYPTNQFDPAWWFGFDCAHDYDIAIKYDMLHLGEVPRLLPYVIQECENMIDQLICIKDTLAEVNTQGLLS